MNKNNIITNHMLTLANGYQIPQMGFGTYKITISDGYQAIYYALSIGYRHIDTAEYYGNESLIGQVISDFLTKNPDVKRSDLFITSKIWNDHQTQPKTKAAVADILARLKLDYLDLCLIHWPQATSLECWKELENLYQNGLIKAIGVSNFTISHLQGLLKKAKIKPMVNQIETHPGHPQTELVQFCQKNNIVVISWRTMNQGKGNEVPLLLELAAKYQVDSSRIALRWAWQLHQVIIPKSVAPSRIASNLDLANFKLTKAEINAINKLPENGTGLVPGHFVWEV